MRHLGWFVVVICACGNTPSESERDATRMKEAREALARDPAWVARQAREETERLVKASSDARAKVGRLAAELAALDVQVGAAVDLVVEARTDNDRQAANDGLERLRRQKRELETRLAQAQAAAERADHAADPRCRTDPKTFGCT